MDQQHGSDPGGHTGPDPSLWRGLTRPRLSQQGMSRRQLLRSAGAGAGALGVGAFLAACGVKGATTTSSGSTPAGGAGTPAWWAKQKLHHTVNFANWPYYIDVLKGKHLSLEHFTQTTGIQVTYTEPINDNLPFYAKIRPSLQAKQSTGYDIIRPGTRATSTRWPGSPAGPRSGTTPRSSRTLAPAWTSCSTRSTRARSA
jgi:hypothetical protein